MYRVGQVLYLILNKKQQVIPCQVIEQVVRKKISGIEDTSHIVRVPVKSSFKEYDLSELDAVPYDTIEEVERILFENVSSYIKDITATALKVASNSFGHEMVSGDNLFVDKDNNSSSQQQKEDQVRVTLEDGTVANVNVNIPDEGEVS